MDNHALAILAMAESWNWPLTQHILQSEERACKYDAITPKFLSCLINESQALGGTLLDQFWIEVGNCHPKLKENVEELKRIPAPVPSDQSLKVLFKGVDREAVDFNPIFTMVVELFTHLGVALVNPGGSRKIKSGISTSSSVDDIISMEPDDITLVGEEDVEPQLPDTLRAMTLKRDGHQCVLTGGSLTDPNGAHPVLAHVIPNSVNDKPDTLNYIAMFAGEKTRDLVLQDLNTIGNVIQVQRDARESYENLSWAIEAQTHDGTVNYIYRRLPPRFSRGPGLIRLRDGDKIRFGEGSARDALGQGPLPLLCNLRLAIARAFRMSGAAEVISQLKREADNTHLILETLTSEDICDVLVAKLLLHSGSSRSIAAH